MCYVNKAEPLGLNHVIYSHLANKMFFLTGLDVILFRGEDSGSNTGSPSLQPLSHNLAHKVENVLNPMQSYDIWSVA